MAYRTISALAAAIAVAAATAVATTTPVAAKELIYGSWVSPKHGVNTFALPVLFKGVAKDTNGAITWKMMAGGQLVKSRSTLPGIRDGLVDAGMPIPSYFPKHLPATNSIFSTLVFGTDHVAAGGATTEMAMLRCPQCIKEYKKQKLVMLGGYSASPFMMMCRGEVRTLADLKGKKIRSSGGGVYLVKAAGGVPVAMAPSAATTALQRGALDCVLGAPAWLRSYGYQDVVKYIIDYPLGMVGPVMSLALNRGTWKRMTTAQKKAHLKYAPYVVAHSVISAYILEDEKIIKNAKAKGVTLVKGGQEFADLAAARKIAQRKTNIDNARRFGVKNPESIAVAFEKALKKWRGLSKGIGRDIDKYVEALQREIYDKVDMSKL